MSLDSPYILVSGIEETKYWNDTSDVSAEIGLLDSSSQVYISSITANFGFNSTPSSLEMELVAPDKIVANESSIGNAVKIKIGSINFEGHLAHIDSSVGSNGFITRVRCDDNRKTYLNKWLLHTEPLLQSNLEHVLVVPKINETDGSLYKVNSPLYLINKYGATYGEIYNAINAYEGINLNLPLPGVINNKLGNQEAYRWAFSLTPLFDALLQIFDDCGYDCYFYNNNIHLIDRSKPMSVDESLFASFDKIDYRKGYDETDRPSKYFILGAKKEGGVGTIHNVVEYQNIVSLGATRLTPAWNSIQISYHDSDGRLQRYYPSDTELKMSLKSIEHWTYFKKNELELAGDSTARGWMESRLDPDAFGIENSVLEAALSFGGGRSDVYRVIHNRRALGQNWLVAWYEAVSRHAQTYYGKLYYCKPSDDFLKNCNTIDSAWVADDVDNRVIADAYSPFYNDGKIQAFFQVPTDQVKGFGVDGTATPLSFSQWNETSGTMYMPMNVTVHSPSRDEDRVFPGITDARLFVTLPEIVVESIEKHPLLDGLATLEFFDQNNLDYLTTSGSVEDRFQLYLSDKDTNDPRIVISPLSGVDNFFIPVQYNIRYGDDGTTLAGTTSGVYRGEIDDKYAPWVRQNPQSPITDMSEKSSLVVSNSNADDFYETTVVGLPTVNFFANFSDEDYVPQYPFTAISVSVGSNGLTTRYSAKSQLIEILKDNKIEYSRFKGRLDRIKHFANLSKLSTEFNANIDFSTGKISQITRRPTRGTITATTSSRKPEEERTEVEQRSFIRTVTITKVVAAYVKDSNLGTGSVRMEFYQGEDDQGNPWPAQWSNFIQYKSMDPGDDVGEQRNIQVMLTGFGYDKTRSNLRYRGYAPCSDGYLREGMVAQYHHEDIHGTTYTYFTGGINLENTKFVNILTDITQSEAGYYYANVETISHVAGVRTFQFNKVPFLNNDTVSFQGYTIGKRVPLIHNYATKGGSADSAADINQAGQAGGTIPQSEQGVLRPDSDHVDEVGNPVGDLYIANPPTINAILVTVITPPDTETGVGGVVQAANTDQLFGKIQGDNGEGEDLYFVGVPSDQIFEGDYGIMTKSLDGANWQVLINKPLFSPYREFGA